MKTEVISLKPNAFEPVQCTIVLETPAELSAFLAVTAEMSTMEFRDYNHQSIVCTAEDMETMANEIIPDEEWSRLKDVLKEYNASK